LVESLPNFGAGAKKGKIKMGIYHSSNIINKKIRPKKINLNDYTVEQSTHNLSCRHQIGRNGFNYTMPCIVLWKRGAKAKIIVFGERAWANKDHIKHIRYVNRYMIKIKPAPANIGTAGHQPTEQSKAQG
jgi:hypothetical protein